MYSIDIGLGLGLTIITAIFGIFSPIIIGQFRPIKKIKKAAILLDKFTIDTAGFPTVMEISRFREYDRLGDKITVAHFLTSFIRDILRKIQQQLIYGTLITFVVQFLIIIYTKTDQNNPYKNILDKFKNYPIPFLIFVVVIQLAFILQVIHDQSHKFDNVIKQAKASEKKKKPLLIRLVKIIRIRFIRK